jgi:hypothetical protein
LKQGGRGIVADKKLALDKKTVSPRRSTPDRAAQQLPQVYSG